jgi:hypothetical protein
MRIMTTIAAGGQAGLATLFGSGIANAEPGFEPLGSYGKRDQGKAGRAQRVRYLSDCGTVEDWRQAPAGGLVMAEWIGLAVFFGVPLLTILLITGYVLLRPAKAYGHDPEHNWCLTMWPLPLQPWKPAQKEEES